MSEAAHVAKATVDAVERADLTIVEAVAEQRERPFVKLAGKLSEVADQPPLRAIILGATALGLARRDPRLTRTGLRMAAAHTLATLAKELIEHRVDRTRPDTALDEGYLLELGGTETHELSSFPSGHTAGALAVTQALARDYPRSRAAGLATTAAIAAIQIPRCKHFVSDILAGAAIGWTAERVSSRLFDWAEEKLATSDS